ncbi:hypothetical protein [Terriglobus sp. TAA 43]|uniref:hypothetical protein n=1 Tax=Terriglobus sp. TAA 43 TaxID=278961 RepID=UPI00064599BD|nr:hypothetical protein [Terriglobus sp. TAA 43]
MIPEMLPETLAHQAAILILLAIPIACMSWTVTHEEVFREPREYCKDLSQNARSLPRRKFFYLFTCEYCFSHYVTALVLLVTHFQLLYSGWRGYVLAEFALVYLANVYMSLYNRLRLDIKHENVSIAVEEAQKPE